jgi:hypothetical protein
LWRLPSMQARNMEATTPGSSQSPVAFHRSDRPLMSVTPSLLPEPPWSRAARYAPIAAVSETVSEAVGRPELVGLRLLQFQNASQATLSWWLTLVRTRLLAARHPGSDRRGASSSQRRS